MGEYGSGLTLGKMFNMEKERIRHALNGMLAYDEDETGFKYRKASKEECDRFILSRFDNAVYHCLESNSFGHVYDKIIQKHGITITLQDILIYKTLVDSQPCDYEYEPFDKDEVIGDASLSFEALKAIDRMARSDGNETQD